MKRASAAQRIAEIHELLTRGASDEEDPIVCYTVNGTLVSRMPTQYELRELYRLSAPARKERKR